MSEWVSPIDGHRHFGDAGRAECAVCCLEADRDHWRVLARREAAERDRLRAVVDAVRAFRRTEDDHEDDDLTPERLDDAASAWRQVVALLDQLVVRPTGEDT